MKNHKLKIFSISTVIFLLSFSLVFGAGYYRATIPMESGRFRVDLPLPAEKQVLETVTFNIQNEGLAKRLFQPGKIAIGTGHGGGLVNHGQTPLWVRVDSEGFYSEVEATSTNLAFDPKTNRFSIPIKPGESFVIDFDVSLTREQISHEGLIDTGKFLFFDDKSGQLLAAVPVQIINSKVKTPTQKANNNWRSGR
jgi:hypothetical protein